MYVLAKYSQIQSDTYRYARPNTVRYSQIQSDTYRYALLEKCICACIQAKNTVTYIQICTAVRNAYVHVSACMSAEYSRHTGTYALDTAPMSRRYIQIQCNTCRYKSVHITYALCICDMHSVVSCAYVSAYVYVFLAHTSHIYQSISVMYVLKIHTHMHLQVH